MMLSDCHVAIVSDYWTIKTEICNLETAYLEQLFRTKCSISVAENENAVNYSTVRVLSNVGRVAAAFTLLAVSCID